MATTTAAELEQQQRPRHGEERQGPPRPLLHLHVPTSRRRRSSARCLDSQRKRVRRSSESSRTPPMAWRDAPRAQIVRFATVCARIEPRPTRPRAHARKGRSRGTRAGAVMVPGPQYPPLAGDEQSLGKLPSPPSARHHGPKELLRTPNGVPPQGIEQPPCLCVDPQGGRVATRGGLVRVAHRRGRGAPPARVELAHVAASNRAGRGSYRC
ncbi:unnamed protein product [Urochloa humidicola]